MLPMDVRLLAGPKMGQLRGGDVVLNLVGSGFIEIEKLLFGEKTSVVVDPTEENLKNEFNGVERTYIPMHSIIRIDEVKKQGTAKISDGNDKSENIMPFPIYTKSNTDADSQ